MNDLGPVLQRDLLNPSTTVGAAFLGLVFLGLAIGLMTLVLRDAESHEIIVPNGVMMSSVVIRISERKGESGPNR